MSTNKKKVEEKFRLALKDNALLSSGDKVLVGFSGGSDSTLLVYLLKQVVYQYKLKLRLVYFNHQLRGGESKRESEFIKVRATEFKLPLTLKKIDPRQYSKKNKLNLEEAGRILRYGYLEKLAISAGFNKIALGHHLDDNAETVLFNMARGASFAGLRGIPVKREIKPSSGIYIIRPLADISRKDIIEYLSCAYLPYFEDSSNKDDSFSRNLIRNRVLKELELVNPAVREHLKNISNDAIEFEQFKGKIVCSSLDRVVLNRKGKKALDLLVFFGYDKFLQKEGICELWRRVGKAVARKEYIEKIIKNLEKVFARGIRYVDVNRLTGKNGVVPVAGICEKSNHSFKPLGLTKLKAPSLSIKGRLLGEKPESVNSTATRAYFDWGGICGCGFSVRFRKEGDRFRPYGMRGTKKLSDFFNERKVKEVERDKIPLVFAGGELIWVVGLRTSEYAKITQGTKEFLELHISRLRG